MWHYLGGVKFAHIVGRPGCTFSCLAGTLAFVPQLAAFLLRCLLGHVVARVEGGTWLWVEGVVVVAALAPGLSHLIVGPGSIYVNSFLFLAIKGRTESVVGAQQSYRFWLVTADECRAGEAWAITALS